MKNIILSFISISFISFTVAQQKGNIYSNELSPKAGIENHYTYEPPKGLVISPKVKASILYLNKQYFKKNISLTKTGDKYGFTFKAPDSTNVLLIAIEDDDKIIDNNNGSDYISYLHDAKGKRFTAAMMNQALMSGFAGYYHKLTVPLPVIIKMYEEGFKANPALKNEKLYTAYLALLYKQQGDTAKPVLLKYAKGMLAKNGSEENWLNAAEVYGILKMVNEEQQVKDKILGAYPNGALAIRNFWEETSKEKETTEETVLAAMSNYQHRFKDSSASSTIRFYMQLIGLAAKNKDWAAVLKYGSHVDNNLWLASSYNNIAWDLSGAGLSGEGKELDAAKNISKRSLDLVKEKIDHPAASEDRDELTGTYNWYADTYALILYKLNNFDSAFYYQNAILQRGPMGPDGTERYAAYAEKSKGALFAKNFIESQLSGGDITPTMIKQLQSLYQQLHLPEEDFLKVKEKATLFANKKIADKVIAKLGTQKGAEFNLKDLQGKVVSLSSLKGKVVVMDFWATWCGPCKASFPAMQQLVTKYKDDPEVVFLFIDVWERSEPKVMHENAVKFISDNKYSFQVLLDEKNTVADDYKVEAIPAKFVINRSGNIVFMGEGDGDLALVIEAAKTN